ncbi:terminase large subunit [Nocardiopsis terrae]|uniref:terminase large subunit n=1 Tax=Streptomyces sp. NPDC057554 TaxID=3350538 RepID=UPI0036BDDECD
MTGTSDPGPAGEEFPDPEVCGWTHRGHSCEETGDHFCVPRADHAEGFFRDVLVHTKGRYARKPFVLTSWQRDDIVRPLFGEATWNPEIGEYVRRYRVAWIELGRKNGKSEILAGIMLYLLVADGEESAELYGAARDRDQAALVFDVAAQMVRLSPKLSKRVQVKDANKRLVYKKTNSYYQVIAADAQGALGSNPHGVAADEILAWRNRSMWDALRSGMGSGARKQPLMVAATTAGDNPNSFAANMHNEMERVQDDPDRAPHMFTFLRNTPQDADPWDEKHWFHANPALGDFLSLKSMREEALEAKNEPTAEQAFKQFRLNMWVRAATRWMPMPLYNAAPGDTWDTPEDGRESLLGRTCYGGLDLSAKFDLTAWCLLFEPEEPGGPVDVMWRFWVTEEALTRLDKANDNRPSQWAAAGWLSVHDGGLLDFDRIYDDIAQDGEDFVIKAVHADDFSSLPVLQKIGDLIGLDMDEGEILAYRNTYDRMTPALTETMGLVKTERFAHHNNPVAAWNFDAVEVRHANYDPDKIRPDKPNRAKDGYRIDGVAAAAMGANAMVLNSDLDTGAPSAYENRGLTVA